jgi:ParB-like chromosome segregation protein Spo0J
MKTPSRNNPPQNLTEHNVMEIQIWPIDKFVLYARNPRKNDAAVDRMCASIREFGFKIPCLVRSSGEVIDGHLRLKAARKLGVKDIPVILCDEWTPAQVKAFRLMVNRSATWADWDDELLTLELQDLQTSNLDLAVTGFDAKEIEDLQEWVEFVEVPGPPPSQPPADPWLPTCINVVFVEPYPSQLNAP